MRQSGILLHITSLPGPEGIGTMGKEAYQFADFLKAADMAIWQVLPISPTGYGESPYQSFSTYAGNPLLIDLALLVEEGLLKPEQQAAQPNRQDSVDYVAVIAHKEKRLREAFAAAQSKLDDEIAAFVDEQSHWLPDYALFRALKAHFGGGSWLAWPDEAIRHRQPDAMRRYAQQFRDEIAFHSFVQYLFFRQWRTLKEYANGQGIRLFGDMPIYVAMDSSDTWAHPEVFQLDVNLKPLGVAGVPPDYFSRNGQLWGNPLYNWKALKRTGYRWWMERMRAMGEYFDLIRVDHFIGFSKYYDVPYGATTARWGQWRRGPGRAFFDRLNQDVPGLNIVAEDLGAVDNRVRGLLKYCGYPGMKVLCFAFSGEEDNPHLPYHIPRNCVYYTGTHDNDTAMGWWESAASSEKKLARKLLGFQKDDQLCEAMLAGVLQNKANTAILPMQDILCLPTDARMNTPGTLGGNWQWRMKPGVADEELAARLRELNHQYGRGKT